MRDAGGSPGGGRRIPVLAFGGLRLFLKFLKLNPLFSAFTASRLRKPLSTTGTSSSFGELADSSPDDLNLQG